MTDQQQIRELQALWGQYEADHDAEAWSHLFAEDSTYIRPNGMITHGRSAIRDSLVTRTAGRQRRHTAHVFGPAVIRVSGETAESATDHVAFGRTSAEQTWEIIAIGRMNNRLIRQDGRWYFSEVGNRGYYWGTPPPDRFPGLPRTQPGGPPSDEEQVEEVIARYAQHESDKDPVAWSDLFAEDGKYIRPHGEVADGRAAIRRSREGRNAQRSADRHTAHICAPSVIRVSGDTAESTTDYVAYGRAGTDHPWTIVAVGRLHGELVRQAGLWYFSTLDNRAYFWGDPPPERLPRLSRVW